MSEEILAMSPVFQGIPRDDVKRMLDAGVIQQHPSGDVVIKEGEYNDSLYVVLEGALEVCLPDSDERFGKVGLATVGPGQCVGEYSFIDRHPTSASVITRGETRLFTVRNEDFVRFLAKHTGIGCIIYRNLLKILIERLRENNAMLDMVRPRR